MLLIVTGTAERVYGQNNWQQGNIPDAYKIIDTIEGAGLFSKTVSVDTGSYEVYLQVINLKYISVSHIISETGNKGLKEGRYYNGYLKSNSPYYKAIPQAVVLGNLASLGGRVFSVINAAFFEEYNDSTQLAFPIKIDGKVLTGGSSPYGPCDSPMHAYYKKAQLKALVINRESAAIMNYHHQAGYPLNLWSVKNALVTYSYKDHPANLLANNPVNRYHVIGTLNNDNIPGDELLLILTVNKTTLENAAGHLRQLGVKGDIITVDGGSSVFLYNSSEGIIQYPGLMDKAGKTSFIRLPHYLVFMKKELTEKNKN